MYQAATLTFHYRRALFSFRLYMRDRWNLSDELSEWVEADDTQLRFSNNVRPFVEREKRAYTFLRCLLYITDWMKGRKDG